MAKKLFPATDWLSQKQQVASFSCASQHSLEVEKLTVKHENYIKEGRHRRCACWEREQPWESMHEKVFQDADL